MLKDDLIAELKMESALTKKMLERVPLDQAGWKPHEKSTSVGRLATHVAEIPNWIDIIVRNADFDFMSRKFSAHVAASTEELLSIFQENLDKAIAALETMSDEDFNRTWTVKRGEHVVSSNPKKASVRGWGFSHLFHHRGQLSVYLRLLNIPVPGMYGPSADER